VKPDDGEVERGRRGKAGVDGVEDDAERSRGLNVLEDEVPRRGAIDEMLNMYY
jgi:hypothetical protein